MNGISHPLLRRLYDDWNAWRGDRAMPARRDFDPIDIKYILGNISLIEIEQQQPLRFRYRIHGTNISQRFGYELTGKDLESHPDSVYRRLLRDHFTAVIAKREPIGLMRERQMGEHHIYRHESLVLPLSRDGEQVDMLISAVCFR